MYMYICVYTVNCDCELMCEQQHSAGDPPDLPHTGQVRIPECVPFYPHPRQGQIEGKKNPFKLTVFCVFFNINVVFLQCFVQTPVKLGRGLG